jgi:poly(3-hydroxybutyrate) depolymerase
MWFAPDIDPLFERLITNMIVFEGIDPNKVYINGYSAGGDGVYQLGPRMADHWASAWRAPSA